MNINTGILKTERSPILPHPSVGIDQHVIPFIPPDRRPLIRVVLPDGGVEFQRSRWMIDENGRFIGQEVPATQAGECVVRPDEGTCPLAPSEVSSPATIPGNGTLPLASGEENPPMPIECADQTGGWGIGPLHPTESMNPPIHLPPTDLPCTCAIQSDVESSICPSIPPSGPTCLPVDEDGIGDIGRPTHSLVNGMVDGAIQPSGPTCLPADEIGTSVTGCPDQPDHDAHPQKESPQCPS